MIMRLLIVICCAVTFSLFHAQIVCADQPVYSKKLTVENVEPAIMSVSFGGIRTKSGIIDMSDIDQNTIEIIDVHQEGNAAIVYCNFTHKKGEKLFGYIPLVRLKNSTVWVNRDNRTILANK